MYRTEQYCLPLRTSRYGGERQGHSKTRGVSERTFEGRDLLDSREGGDVTPFAATPPLQVRRIPELPALPRCRRSDVLPPLPQIPATRCALPRAPFRSACERAHAPR